jgi:hypothetical protein
LDSAEHERDFASLDFSAKANLNSEMLEGASLFLTDVPSKEFGLAWGPEEFIVELKKRLGADVYPEDSWCPLCDCVLDRKGHHAGLCAAGGHRVRKHNVCRNNYGFFFAKKEASTRSLSGLACYSPPRSSLMLNVDARPTSTSLPGLKRLPQL